MVFAFLSEGAGSLAFEFLLAAVVTGGTALSVFAFNGVLVAATVLRSVFLVGDLLTDCAISLSLFFSILSDFAVVVGLVAITVFFTGTAGAALGLIGLLVLTTFLIGLGCLT